MREETVTNSGKPHFHHAYITKRFAEEEEAIACHAPKLRRVIWERLKSYLTDLNELRAGSAKRTPIKGSKRGLFHTNIDHGRRIVDEPYDKSGMPEVVMHRVGEHEVCDWAETYNGNTEVLMEKAKVLKKEDFLPSKEKTVTKEKSRESRLPVYRIPVVEPVSTILVDEEALDVYRFIPLIEHFKALSDEQRQLVDKELGAVHAVKGAAGSGKTIVALRRIERVINDPQLDLVGHKQKILYLCHNQLLADLSKQVINYDLDLEGKRSVDIKTVYSFISTLVREDNESVNYTEKDKLMPYLKLIVGENVKDDFKLSPEEVYDEIAEIILGRYLRTEDMYLETDRTGMGKRLDKSTRKVVWVLFDKFMRKCKQIGKYPWERMTTHVLKMSENSVPSRCKRVAQTYTHVYVDEAQDLTPSVYLLLRRLFGDSDKAATSVVMYGDSTQSIYRRGFRWNLTGYKLQGRTTILKKCYRSTTPIIYASRPLIEGQGARFGEEDLLIPDALEERDKRRKPPKVQIVIYKDEAAEIYGIFSKVVDVTSEKGFPLSSVAILVNDVEKLKKIQQCFEKSGIKTESYLKDNKKKNINITEESVKLISTWSAKGLEFQNLIIPFIGEDDYPSRDEDGETSDKARRSLYTAMMRSSWALHLSANNNYSGLLNELTAQYVERTGGA